MSWTAHASSCTELTAVATCPKSSKRCVHEGPCSCPRVPTCPKCCSYRLKMKLYPWSTPELHPVPNWAAWKSWADAQIRRWSTPVQFPTRYQDCHIFKWTVFPYLLGSWCWRLPWWLRTCWWVERLPIWTSSFSTDDPSSCQRRIRIF